MPLMFSMMPEQCPMCGSILIVFDDLAVAHYNCGFSAQKVSGTMLNGSWRMVNTCPTGVGYRTAWPQTSDDGPATIDQLRAANAELASQVTACGAREDILREQVERLTAVVKVVAGEMEDGPTPNIGYVFCLTAEEGEALRAALYPETAAHAP